MKLFKHFALTVLVALVSNISASAYDFEYNGLYYKITTPWNSSQNTCEVTYGPSGKDKSDYTLENVVVPEGVAYGGSRYLVTSIGENAFYNNKSIKTLKVEGNVTKIGEYAFYSCSNLTSVQLNESVKNIGKSAFCNDFEVAEFKMPGVEVVGSMALGYLKKLRILEIPACTRHFPADAIPYLQSLEEIIVSEDNPYFVAENGVLYTKDKKHIRHFPEASRLTEFSVPEGVEEIDTLCFFWSGLRKITVPNTVKKIRCRAFGSCYNLEELNLPQSVEEMGEYATFMYCPKLKLIDVPNNVKMIKDNSYIGLIPNLETVVFGESITSFPSYCIDLYGSSSEGIPNNNVYKNTVLLSKTVPTNWESLPGTKWVRRELSWGNSSYRQFEYIFNYKPQKDTWYEASLDFTGLYCVGDTLFAFSGNSKRTKPSDMSDYASKSDYKYNSTAEFYYHDCVAFDFSKSGIKASDFVGKKISGAELIGTPVSNIDDCGIPCFSIFTTPILKYARDGEEYNMNTYRVINFAYPADDGNGFPYYLVKPVIGERCKVTGMYLSSKGGFYDSSLNYVVKIRGAKDIVNYRTYTLEGIIRYITTESSYSGGEYVLDVSGDISFDYEISKQPTKDDLSVELNKSNSQTAYQWYQIEEAPGGEEQINFNNSWDWTLGGYGIWKSKTSSTSNTDRMITATLEIEEGDTLSLNTSIYLGGTLSVTVDGTSIYSNSGVYTKVFNTAGTVTLKVNYNCSYYYDYNDDSRRGYATISEAVIKRSGMKEKGVVLAGATSSKLSEEQFIDGKSVYCIVTLPHGQKLVSDIVQTKENFISKQPTALDLSVELSMPTDKATYQWFKEGEVEELQLVTKDISDICTTSGTYPWTYNDGVWTSGNKRIDSSSSTLQLSYQLFVGESLQFDCWVNSESFDKLTVTSSLGDEYKWIAGGYKKSKSYYVKGTGEIQNWKFVYSKDSEDYSYDDCAKVYNIKATVFEGTGHGVGEKIEDATNSIFENLNGLHVGDVVYCEITLPNGRLLRSDRITLNDYSFGSSRTITYIVNGKVFLTEEYEIGSTIMAPEPPIIEGYTFVRWENLPDVMPVNDLTVTAVYKENKCKIYNGNNHVINSRYISLENKPEAANAANALIFVDESINENAGENFIMKDADDQWQARSIVLTDAQPFYCPTNVESEMLIYTRNFRNTNYQPLYVPFSMSVEDWDEFAIVYRINAYYETDTDGDGEIDEKYMEIVKVKPTNGDLKPNHPYMIKAKNPVNATFEMQNKTLYATADNSIDCSTVDTKYTFTGTYQPLDHLASGNRYVMSGGALCAAATDAVTLNAFRWFMEIESRDGQFINRPQMVKIKVAGEDDDALGIENVETIDDNADGKIFTIDGRMVDSRKLSRGIYIKNGKKLYIK